MANKLTFDPYRAWLNVVNPHRPPNAYAMLGLDDFEQDLVQVREAAIRQRGAIQDCRRSAEDRRVWLRMNNQLEEAINILTDPERKSDYDAKLPTDDESKRPTPVDKKKVAADGGAAVGVCAACGTRNGEDRKFCAQCGDPLKEPCPGCNAPNATGEAFCGQCGTNLAQARGQQAEQFEQRLQQAEEYAAAHRYDAAISVFTELGKDPHPRLKDLAARATARAREVVVERDQSNAGAAAALDEARSAIASHEDETALEILRRVPEELRQPDHEQLTQLAEDRLRDVNQLVTQIRQMIGKAAPVEVVPLIQQLQALRPDHPLANELAPKLYAHLHRTGTKLVNRLQYGEGLELLEKIPAPYRTEEMDKLQRQTEELAYLSDCLSTSPYVDNTLLHIAERLIKFSPQDKTAADLLPKIQKRGAQPPKDPLLAAPTWVQAPPKTFLGPPVDWIAGFRRVIGQEALNSPYFMEHRGGFFVACGLALQGLGQSPLTVNLANAARGSVVEKLSKMVRRRRAMTPSAWGVDISASGLKAIRLVHYQEAGSVVVDACDFIKHDKNLNEPSAQADRRAILAETLTDFVGRHDLKADTVCVGMHRSMVLGRFFKLPPVVPKKIPAIVQYEVGSQVPDSVGRVGLGLSTS